MMKIQLLLILSAAFNMANPLPIRISPACRQLAIKGFPFYGKESVTLSEMLNNHEKTGLGKDHLAQQKIIFQQQDYNDNGLLEVEEKFYDEYSKMKKGENSKDFEFADKDKNGLISMSELKSYSVALGLLDPNISEDSTGAAEPNAQSAQLRTHILSFMERKSKICAPTFGASR